jgi:hypothetical protein
MLLARLQHETWDFVLSYYYYKLRKDSLVTTQPEC